MANVPAIIPIEPDHKHVHCTTSDSKQKDAPATADCKVISEKQFMRDHSLYSGISSWLFAIAGATNIGVLSVVAAKILGAAEQNRPLFKSKDPAVQPVFGNKKYNRIAMMMVGFGGVCMAASNWLESKKVVTEWQLGAGKLQRKVNIAEKEQPQGTPAGDASTGDASTPAQAKNWTASVQAKASETLDKSASIGV